VLLDIAGELVQILHGSATKTLRNSRRHTLTMIERRIHFVLIGLNLLIDQSDTTNLVFYPHLIRASLFTIRDFTLNNTAIESTVSHELAFHCFYSPPVLLN
jgi:hypothetical protein